MLLENLSIGTPVFIVKRSPAPDGTPVAAVVREINVDKKGNEKEGYEGKRIGVETVEHFPGLHVLTPTMEVDENDRIVRDEYGQALGLVESGHGWYCSERDLAPRNS